MSLFFISDVLRWILLSYILHVHIFHLWNYSSKQINCYYLKTKMEAEDNIIGLRLPNNQSCLRLRNSALNAEGIRILRQMDSVHNNELNKVKNIKQMILIIQLTQFNNDDNDVNRPHW